MRFTYHESEKCPRCEQVFILFIPLYIALFMPELRRRAFQQHDFEKVKHAALHMRDKWQLEKQLIRRHESWMSKQG